ncbi:MAG: ArnT family glycosyltransferase [Vicinamibacterales bacterium]
MLVALAGVLAVYAGQLRIGLYYDDYGFVRPWSLIDLHRVWYGSWDPTGIEPTFYRPLAAYLYAGRFWLFGLNATAMHAVSIAGHVLCAVLVGWFLRRERSGAAFALFGVWLYAVFPAFPYAQVSWLTNQIHLAESIVVLGALLVWQVVRDRTLIWWTPIALLAIAVFLIKEDGVMLLPAIVSLTLLRSWLDDSRSLRRWLPHAAIALLVATGLMALRAERLGRLGGYGWPSIGQAEINYVKGIQETLLLWPTRPRWQALASAIAIAALLGGLVTTRWRHGRRVLWTIWAGIALLLCRNLTSLLLPSTEPLVAWQPLAGGIAVSALTIGVGVAASYSGRSVRFVVGTGLVLFFWFNLPFVLVSKREQYHLLGLAAVLVLAGAAQALYERIERPMTRRAGAVLLLAATVPFLLLARHLGADFLPCAPMVAADNISAWWVVPDEIKSYVARRSEACHSGAAVPPLSELPLVSWGVYDQQRDPGEPAYRWTADQAVLLARRATTTMTLALRQPEATTARPVVVTIDSDSRHTVVTLASKDWQYATVPLSPGLLAWIRAGQRVDIRVTPWFVPAVVDPRSTDVRRRGVELRVDLR